MDYQDWVLQHLTDALDRASDAHPPASATPAAPPAPHHDIHITVVGDHNVVQALPVLSQRKPRTRKAALLAAFDAILITLTLIVITRLIDQLLGTAGARTGADSAAIVSVLAVRVASSNRVYERFKARFAGSSILSPIDQSALTASISQIKARARRFVLDRLKSLLSLTISRIVPLHPLTSRIPHTMCPATA